MLHSLTLSLCLCLTSKPGGSLAFHRYVFPHIAAVNNSQCWSQLAGKYPTRCRHRCCTFVFSAPHRVMGGRSLFDQPEGAVFTSPSASQQKSGREPKPLASSLVSCQFFFPFCWQFGKDLRNKRPTCCAAVFADGEPELLPGCCNLEVVVHGVDSLRAHTQVEPQLVPSGRVGQLVDLLQTWRGMININVGMCFASKKKKKRKTGVLTKPELLCHVAKACHVLPPALQKVQPASRTSLEHLRGSSSIVSLTSLCWKHFSNKLLQAFGCLSSFIRMQAGNKGQKSQEFSMTE